MIKLTQQSPHLSLQIIENYILEDFSVITGLNGSGKTHFLNALNQGIFKVENIDTSGISYYNYNDFNLFNGDISYKNKSSYFSGKSSSLAQNLVNQRNQILNEYKLNSDFSASLEGILIHTPEIIQWSEEEIENFEEKQKEDTFVYDSSNPETTFTTKQNSLLNHINQNIKSINIKKWLYEANDFLNKTQILNIIRNHNYNIGILDWEYSQIEKYELLKIENSNFQFQDPMFGISNNSDFNQDFVSFVISIQQNQNLKEYELGILKSTFRKIYDDMIKFFKKNISSEYLQLSIQINGENNILKQISVDSGFLNLQDIANAEKNYQVAKEQNQYNEFQSDKKNINIHFYSETEFLKIHGDSPVKLLNAVLNEYDCNGYEFRQSKMNFYFGTDISKQNVRISLFNKKGNYDTTLDALSSGEKTLIALSFYIYKLQKKNIITNLLLLDEIDSALHPSMSKRLLDVLYNIFYKQMGIKIIISTHSPSTVALAPEDSIFVMDKYSSPKIMKVSKDKALKELTLGVPSFSINYENRRQVFVESDYDANYYESLYNIYNEKLIPEISLNFISSGKTKINGNGIGISSCDQVVNIVNILRKAGNNFSWGIIDWDLKNKSSNHVKVLGNSERYSIENYLLDPLLLGILLWKENILKSEDFGLDKNEVYFNVLNFNQSLLQQIIDKIISDLNTKRDENDLNESKNYTLCNGITLQLPTWYCEIQGHSLEENIIMKTYPQLESIRKKDESALKKAAINKVIFNFKNLVCVDLVDIFKSIQEE